jgi:hypothetical protein
MFMFTGSLASLLFFRGEVLCVLCAREMYHDILGKLFLLCTSDVGGGSGGDEK